MARIILPTAPPVSISLLKLTQNIVLVSQQTTRLKSVVDQITNNGANKALLEASSESQFPPGTGAALYDGLAQIKTALDSLATLVSAIDQGA